jgi:hypothetical protein
VPRVRRQLLERVPDPIAVIPRMLVQPVAACEVADALVALVTGAPAGLAPDLGGREQRQLTGAYDPPTPTDRLTSGLTG